MVLFRLSAAEVETLNWSQIATRSQKHRDPRFPPYAFTEHGAIMVSTVLNQGLRQRIAYAPQPQRVDFRDGIAINIGVRIQTAGKTRGIALDVPPGSRIEVPDVV